MGVKLDSVVPWGRLLSEYVGMFNLTEADLQRSIVDVGGGPASFNAEATAQGAHIISIDPIYEFSGEQIEQRVNETYDVMLSEVQRNQHLFVWDMFKTPQELGECRLQAMRGFLADFSLGLQQGRYLVGGLPELSFAEKQFDLALCSNFLFLYSDKLSTEFHLQSLREMCRVATEVRIFPLRDMANQPSEHINPVIKALVAEGYNVQRVQVPYEFRHGCHHMLQIMGE